ncbi:MAG: hypothetical protein RIQ54_334 [Candidatus Parcubacteria bacterium]
MEIDKRVKITYKKNRNQIAREMVMYLPSIARYV